MAQIKRVVAILAALAVLLCFLPSCKAPQEEAAPEKTADPGETAATEAPETEAMTQTEAPTESDLPSAPETEEAETEAPTESETQPEPLSAEAEAQLDVLRDWLRQPHSFELVMYYSYYPLYGFQYSIRQLMGQDESFRFTTVYATFPSQSWADGDKTADYWETEQTDWYYRYEDGGFICYDPWGQVSEVTAADRAAMDRDSDEITGVVGVLPEGLADFAEAEAQEADTRVFVYRVPISALQASGSMGGIFLNWAVGWSEDMATLQPIETLEPDDPSVTVQLTVESETLRPIRAHYDFTELKPYLFGDGPLSAEYAMDVDVLYMDLEISYDMPETVAQDTILEEGFLH